MSRPRWMAVSLHTYPSATGAVDVLDIIGPQVPFCVIRETDQASACAAVLASGLVPGGMRPIADSMAGFLKAAGCRTIRKYLSLPMADRQPTLAERQAAEDETDSAPAVVPVKECAVTDSTSLTIDLPEELHRRFSEALGLCGMAAEGVLERDILCFCERAEAVYAHLSVEYGVLDADALFLVLWTFERAERLATSVPSDHLVMILDGEVERLQRLREEVEREARHRSGRELETTPAEET